MTLRLTDGETDALRRQAELEHRSMQEITRQAIREYLANHTPAGLPDQLVDGKPPGYGEVLKRLAQRAT